MIVELGSESRLAFAMVSHPRLGAASLLCELDESIVRMVVELTTHETRVMREMQPGDCFEVRPSEGSWAPRYQCCCRRSCHSVVHAGVWLLRLLCLA